MKTKRALTSVYEYARYYALLGLSVIPLKFRDKTPVINWKAYQTKHPSDIDLKK